MSAPTIDRSLLGDDGHQRLKERLLPTQQAIVVSGDGIYSFKGSAYVRGGIFDRIEILQEGSSTRFRDRNHTRLGAHAAVGAPDLREIGLFVTPPEFTLDPAQPWRLQLLVQRSVGARDKAFLTFDLDYTLPDRYPDVVGRTETILPIVDRAVSTSGAYGFRFDPQGRFNHLFNPTGGGPPDRYRSVTTLSGDATAADALSTAFSLMPELQIQSLLPRVEIERVHIIDATDRAGPGYVNKRDASDLLRFPAGGIVLHLSKEKCMKRIALAAIFIAIGVGRASAQDAAAGEKVFVICKACHQAGDSAKNAVGPVLNGLFGRKAGSVEGYSYSAANKDSGITWMRRLSPNISRTQGRKSPAPR